MGLVGPLHVGSSRTRARTRVPCIGRQILNRCATRGVPQLSLNICLKGKKIKWLGSESRESQTWIKTLAPQCTLRFSERQWVGMKLVSHPSGLLFCVAEPGAFQTTSLLCELFPARLWEQRETASLGDRAGLDPLNLLIVATCLHHNNAYWLQVPVLPTSPKPGPVYPSEISVPAGQHPHF